MVGQLVSVLCRVLTEASLIKWHCEQCSEGNEGANYVHIWEKTIPEKGREFWDISKYKLANCV